MAVLDIMNCVILLILMNLLSCAPYELRITPINSKASEDGKIYGSPIYEQELGIFNWKLPTTADLYDDDNISDDPNLNQRIKSFSIEPDTQSVLTKDIHSYFSNRPEIKLVRTPELKAAKLYNGISERQEVIPVEKEGQTTRERQLGLNSKAKTPAKKIQIAISNDGLLDQRQARLGKKKEMAVAETYNDNPYAQRMKRATRHNPDEWHIKQVKTINRNEQQIYQTKKNNSNEKQINQTMRINPGEEWNKVIENNHEDEQHVNQAQQNNPVAANNHTNLRDRGGEIIPVHGRELETINTHSGIQGNAEIGSESTKNLETLVFLETGNLTLHGVLITCIGSQGISVLDSLREINNCIKSNVPYNKKESTENIIPILSTVETSTVNVSIQPSERHPKSSVPTLTSGYTDRMVTMAPQVNGLTRSAWWNESPIKFWSWDELNKGYAAEFLPVERTCIKILSADVTADRVELLTLYIECNLHVYRDNIVLREVAECLLHNNVNLDTVLPVEYNFNVENCLDKNTVYDPEPVFICIHTVGSSLEYPSISLCIANDTTNLFQELERCGVTDFTYQTGWMQVVLPDEGCEDNEIVSHVMGVGEFYWWARKVQFSCLLLFLVFSIMENVVLIQVTIGKVIRRYVRIILPLSILQLVWRLLLLLFTDIEYEIMKKVGFLLLSKIVEAFPMTINTYLLTAITLEKFIAVSYPLILRKYRHIVTKIFPVAILIASSLSILDVIGNVYFYIIYPHKYSDFVFIHEGIDSLDLFFYIELFSILSVSLRGVLPALICSGVNVANTVTLCKRFYAETDLPTVRSGQLKQNIVCSNVAPILIISCIVEPVGQLYLEMLGSNQLETSSVITTRYVTAIGELLLMLSTGANLIYLCLLCPELWQYYTHKIPCTCQDVSKNQESSDHEHNHLSNKNTDNIDGSTSSVSVSNKSSSSKNEIPDSCAIEVSLEDPEGPYVY